MRSHLGKPLSDLLQVHVQSLNKRAELQCMPHTLLGTQRAKGEWRPPTGGTEAQMSWPSTAGSCRRSVGQSRVLSPDESDRGAIREVVPREGVKKIKNGGAFPGMKPRAS